ncbi:MAG: hypothetical protein WAV93_03765 [Bacteroidales bacterium]
MHFRLLFLKKVLISVVFLEVTLEKAQSSKEQCSKVPLKTISVIYITLKEEQFRKAFEGIFFSWSPDLEATPAKPPDLNSTSQKMCTSPLTRTPPLSMAAFQLRPHSFLLILPIRRKPAFRLRISRW